MSCPLNPSQIDRLLHDLVERYGWIFGDEIFIRENPPDTIDAFTDFILAESGMSPERHPQHRADVRDVVAEYFEETAMG